MSIRAMIAKGMTARAISERTGISLEDIGRYMSATATRKLEELPVCRDVWELKGVAK